MSTVDYIKNSLAFTHRGFTDATNGTDEQLHFVPERGSHSIAWCLWHTARVEDLIINVRSRGADQVWNEDWAERIGLPFEGMGTGMSDDDAQGIRIKNLDAFREYQRAVWDQTEQFLSSASDADLERDVPTPGGETETVGQGIFLHMVGHFNGHRGEINTLRGMQGMPTVLQREGTH
jgi:uncharacterized damage-inducible protein DinB